MILPKVQSPYFLREITDNISRGKGKPFPKKVLWNSIDVSITYKNVMWFTLILFYKQHMIKKE